MEEQQFSKMRYLNKNDNPYLIHNPLITLKNYFRNDIATSKAIILSSLIIFALKIINMWIIITEIYKNFLYNL